MISNLVFNTRRWLMINLMDNAPEWTHLEILHNPIQRVICFLFKHVPMRDECNMPEHDFCLWCFKLMPFFYKRNST